MSLTHLQEIPPEKTILLVGPPGTGKSTFCQKTILHNLSVDRLIIFVTTEYDTNEAEVHLKEKGLTTTSIDLMKFFKICIYANILFITAAGVIVAIGAQIC